MPAPTTEVLAHPRNREQDGRRGGTTPPHQTLRPGSATLRPLPGVCQIIADSSHFLAHLSDSF